MLKEAITAEYLREALDYNPNTGEFRWKRRPREHFKTATRWRGWNYTFAGKHAGSVDADGYQRIAIDGKTYRANRLAWLYTHGEWPLNIVDHKNRVKLKNDIENLREATPLQNSWNRGISSNNTLGIKGVYFDKRVNKYKTSIMRCGKSAFLGYFDTLEDAVERRRQAALELHGEFACVD